MGYIGSEGRSPLAGLAVNRRNFLAGGAALATSSAALAYPTFLPAPTVVTPEQFGAVGDLHGLDKGTDDTEAFRKMAAHLSHTGGRARISRPHRITGGFAMFAGTLEFTDDGLVRNTTKLPNWSLQHTCLFAGTYFGSTAPTGVNGDPAYAIEPLAVGADRFTLSAGRAPRWFKKDALVYLKDGRRYPDAKIDFRIASHVSVVVAVEGRTVIMRDPVPMEIGGDSAMPPSVITPVGTPLDPYYAVPAPATRVAQGVRVVNGAFESLQTGVGLSQTVHIACHQSDFDFRWLVGSNCLGINPCSDSRIVVRNAACTSGIYELAYFHARVDSPVIRGRRVGGAATGSVPVVSVGEYGHSVSLGEVTVEDAADKSLLWVPVIGMYAPLTQVKQASVITKSGIAMGSGSAGTRGEGTRIGTLVAKGAETGLMVDTDDLSAELVQLIEPIGSRPAAVVIRRTAGKQVAISGVETNYMRMRDERV